MIQLHSFHCVFFRSEHHFYLSLILNELFGFILTHFAHSSHIFSGNSGCILKCCMSWLCLVSIIIRKWINAELRIRIKSKWAISWFKSFMMMVCDFSIGISFNFSLLHIILWGFILNGHKILTQADVATNFILVLWSEVCCVCELC